MLKTFIHSEDFEHFPKFRTPTPSAAYFLSEVRCSAFFTSCLEGAFFAGCCLPDFLSCGMILFLKMIIKIKPEAVKLFSRSHKIMKRFYARYSSQASSHSLQARAHCRQCSISCFSHPWAQWSHIRSQ